MMLFVVALVLLETSLTAATIWPGMYPVPSTNQSVRGPEWELATNGIPLTTREFWMRRAQQTLREAYHPRVCPMYPFATVIVNHTDYGDLGDLICTGLNEGWKKGNPILHGEISAIMNCSGVLQDPRGRFRLSPDEARTAMASLTLYTNAESYAMCAAAMRWAGIREYVYGTSIRTLIAAGWQQIRIPSADIWTRSADLDGGGGGQLGHVLAHETDPYFAWQYNASAACPGGCTRGKNGQCS